MPYLSTASRLESSQSPSCPEYEYDNNILKFHCEYKRGSLREYYRFEWRQVLPNDDGVRIVSNQSAFSVNTQDYSLRVNLSIADINGSFLCIVDIPKCVLSLSSPDDIDNCNKSTLHGELQKVPPNYCELACAVTQAVLLSCVVLCLLCCELD